MNAGISIETSDPFGDSSKLYSELCDLSTCLAIRLSWASIGGRYAFSSID